MNDSPLHPGSSLLARGHESPARRANQRFHRALAIVGLSTAVLAVGPPAISWAGPGCSIRPVDATWMWPVRAAVQVRSEGTYAGLWVALDPVTRRPVPPSVEQRLGPNRAPALPEGDNFLPVERLPDGTEMIHLKGRHEVFEVARRDPSGRFRTTCAADSSTAAQIIATPVANRQAVDR